MEFSQLNNQVITWAKYLFLIRYSKTRYLNKYWNMKSYEKELIGGSPIGNDAGTFKLQLIM